MTSSVVWRCIAAAVVAVLVAVGVRAFFGGDDGGGEDFVEAASDEQAISVGDAIRRAPSGTIAIRGYVYDDGSFLQLCNGLVIERDPPACRGPSALLRNLDLARLDLVQATVDGVDVAYTSEPVLLGATILGAEVTVVEVLSGT